MQRKNNEEFNHFSTQRVEKSTSQTLTDKGKDKKTPAYQLLLISS